MRTLNLRFVAILAAGALAGGLCVHFLHDWQVRRNAHAFLREAQRAKEDDRLADAAGYLQRYLHFEPNDVETLAELGTVQAEIGLHQQAFETFEKALRLEPQRQQWRRQLVEEAVLLARYRDAKEHLVQYLLKEEPKDGALLELLGRCQQGLGDDAAAAAAYRQAIRHGPGQIDAYARLADLLRAGMNRPAEADQVMQQLTKTNQQVAAAHVRRGAYLRSTQRLEEAAQEARQALELAPNDREAMLLAIQCATHRRRFDEGRREGERAVACHPQHIPLFVAMAFLETEAGKPSAAIHWLERGLAARPGQVGLLVQLGLFQLDTNDVAGAKTTLEQLDSVGCPPGIHRLLQARIELAEGRWLPAMKGLEEARTALAGQPELVKQTDLWLGRCYERLGNVESQLAAYRRAIDADPLSVPARVGAASALLASGRIDEAIEEYRQIARTDPAAARVPLAELLVLKNLRQEQMERKWTEVDRLLDPATPADPKSIPAIVLRAETLWVEGHVQEAETLLQDLARRYPKRAEPWLALGVFAQRQKRWDRAEECLQEVARIAGDGATLGIARAQYLVARQGKNAVPALEELGGKIDHLPAAERSTFARGLASLFLATGQSKLARAWYAKVSALDPNDLRVRLLRFDLALKDKDDQGLADMLAQIEKIEGKGPHWHYGRAVLLVVKPHGDDASARAEALAHLQEAHSLRPTWSQVPLLMAEIHDSQGNEPAAIDAYLKAVELGDRAPETFRRASQLLYRRQRFAEADQLLARLEERNLPALPELGRMASDVSLRMDKIDRAVELARRSAQDSKEPLDHLWLGHVLLVAADRAAKKGEKAQAKPLFVQAEREIRQALALAPDLGDAWVALVKFLVHTGRKPEAEEAVKNAKAKLDPQKASLAMVQCFEAVGQLREADVQCREAIVARGNDPAAVRRVAEFYLRQGRSSQAEAQLRRLLGKELKAEEDDMVWARRNLAHLLGGRTGYLQLQQALGLVEENLARSTSSLEDLREKGILLSFHPSSAKRQEAARILESVADRQRPPRAHDHLMLAQIYQGLGNWPRAAGHFRRAVAIAPTDAQYVAVFASALLVRGELDEAQNWVNELQRLAPRQFSTVALEARIQFERGDFHGCLATLMKFLTRSDSLPAERMSRIVLTALVLEELSRRPAKAGQKAIPEEFSKEAEKLYREYVDAHPEQKLQITAFHARQGRRAEAVAELESFWAESPPEYLAPTLVAIVAGGRLDAQQTERVEAVLRAAIDKHRRLMPLLLILADLQNSRQHHDEAESLYREILKVTGDHVTAMNNLAMLLVHRGTRIEEARRWIQRAIEIEGPTANLLDTRAIILLAMDKPREALVDLTEALANQPNALIYFHQARCYDRLGDARGASEAMQRARRMGLRSEDLEPLERPAWDRLMSLQE